MAGRVTVAPSASDFQKGIPAVTQWAKQVGDRMTFYTLSRDPVVEEIPNKQWILVKNTITGKVSLWANDEGLLIQSDLNPRISGTVTNLTVATANGFGGTVATATTTPVITLNTNLTGLLKGNGTAMSVAIAGTDYVVPGGSISGSAGSVANPVTFNNSGTGAASGTTFNGAVAQTISYNTIGAQATLVSGTNIKTVNGTTLLGSGNISTTQTITLTGDVTGSGTSSFATTVGKINGVTLSGLATGLLKNTTVTGVPSIAVAGTDYVVPSGSITGTAAGLSATLAISSGGTGATTASAALSALGGAPLTSPGLTGTPTAPTATVGTTTTQIATTAFVNTAVNGTVTTFNTRTGAVTLTSGDVITALGFTPTRRATTFSTGAESSVLAVDYRTVANPSTDIGYAKGVRFRFGFTNDTDGGAGYSDIIDLSTYTDASPGGYNSLYFTKASQQLLHKWATAGGTSWTTKTIAYTDSNITGTAAGLSATLVPASGGTGLTSYTIGDLLYASGTTTLSKLADVATGNALISGGVGTAPSWGKINLTTHVTGTLAVANGGTGVGTVTGLIKGNGTSAFTAAVTGTDYVAPGGALGTPSSGTLTNCTGLPISTGVAGLGSNVATFLATPSSANLAAALTGETGSGAVVFGTNPVIATPILRDPYISQPAPTSLSSGSATLTIAQLLTGIIHYTGSGATLTLPTGANMDAGVNANVTTNDGFIFSVINTGSGDVTMGAATGTTLVGTATVVLGASVLWKVRKTGTATWVVYRIAGDSGTALTV